MVLIIINIMEHKFILAYSAYAAPMKEKKLTKSQKITVTTDSRFKVTVNCPVVNTCLAFTLVTNEWALSLIIPFF